MKLPWRNWVLLGLALAVIALTVVLIVTDIFSAAGWANTVRGLTRLRGPHESSVHRVQTRLAFVHPFVLLAGLAIGVFLGLLAPRLGRGQFRHWSAIGLCALAALMTSHTAQFYHETGLSEYAKKIPRVLGPWIGPDEDVPPDPLTVKILRTTDMIGRRYQHKDRAAEAVDLAVVFAVDNRRAVHAPEMCYAGAGWELAAPKRFLAYEAPDADGQPTRYEVAELLLQKGGLQLVHYWFKAGSASTPRSFRHTLTLWWNNLRGKHATNALIRTATDVSDQTEDSIKRSRRRLADFHRRLFPEALRVLP